MAVGQAAALADVLAEHRGDPAAQALAFEARMGQEIVDRHALSVLLDRARFRAHRGEPAWRAEDGVEAFIQTVVVPAAGEDAEVFRAVRRRGVQLDPIRALAQNAAIPERARALAAARPLAPPPAPAGPTRQELLERIAAARRRETARRPAATLAGATATA